MRCAAWEIKSRIAMAKAAFKKNHLFPSILRLNLRKKLVKCYIRNTAWYGADTSESGQTYLESFEMWCWGRMEKISWTNHVRNEVLQNIKDKRKILQTIKTRKANWTGHILRRNGLSKTRY
jgi:hypothetical protein